MAENASAPKREPEHKANNNRKPENKFEAFQEKGFDGFSEYAKGHIKDTVAYGLLLLGIIWMLFQPLLGGILIGLVAGFYFSNEALRFIKSYKETLNTQGLERAIIAGGVAFAFFIMAPGIFIGAAIMVGLKILLKAE